MSLKAYFVQYVPNNVVAAVKGCSIVHRDNASPHGTCTAFARSHTSRGGFGALAAATKDRSVAMDGKGEMAALSETAHVLWARRGNV